MKNIGINDLLTFRVLYDNDIWSHEVEQKMKYIQQIFCFHLSVKVKVYTSIAELSSHLGILLPDWVKGVAYNNAILLLDPVAWIQGQNDTLSSILLHEYVHTAVFSTFRYLCPIWLNEGLAIYFSGQYKTMKIEQFVDEPNLDKFGSYEKYAIRTLRIIQKYGEKGTIERVKNCNDFRTIEC